MNQPTGSPYFEGPIFFLKKKLLSSSRPVSVSTTHFDREKAEKKRSKLADDGDLSELFDALELEDDGKAAWLVGFFWGDETLPSYFGHYNITTIRIPIKQPVEWKVVRVFFVAQLVLLSEGWKMKKTLQKKKK